MPHDGKSPHAFDTTPSCSRQTGAPDAASSAKNVPASFPTYIRSVVVPPAATFAATTGRATIAPPEANDQRRRSPPTFLAESTSSFGWCPVRCASYPKVGQSTCGAGVAAGGIRNDGVAPPPPPPPHALTASAQAPAQIARRDDGAVRTAATSLGGSS